MSDDIVHNEASNVDNAAGKVMVTGPDGVDVSLTPEAAAKTADRLITHAAEAKGKADMKADLDRRSERDGNV